jgi:hypothetical protein
MVTDQIKRVGVFFIIAIFVLSLALSILCTIEGNILQSVISYWVTLGLLGTVIQVIRQYKKDKKEDDED